MSEVDSLRLANLEAQLSLLRSDVRNMQNETALDPYMIGRGMDDFFGTSNSVLPSTAGRWKQMFDIQISGAELAVQANKADVVGVSFRGAQKSPSAGTGFTWSSGEWTATLSGSKYVFLKFSRETSTVSLEMADSPTFSTPDDYEYHYLWYIDFADGAINGAACVDLRGMVRVEGIA